MAVTLPVLIDPDQPREHCGVFAIWGRAGGVDPASAAYYGLYALQHRGQESAGIAVTDGKTIERHAAMGLVATAFTKADLARLDDHASHRPGHPGGAIGHNRYSTTGASIAGNMQPFVGHFKGGPVAIAHNGNIVNAAALRRQLENDGHAFHTSSDTEVVLQLLAANASVDGDVVGQASVGQASVGQASRLPLDSHDPLATALSQLQGAFSLVLLFNDRIEVARDPWGWRPLAIGEFLDDPATNGRRAPQYVVASETIAFDVLGARMVRAVEPGEIVTLSDDDIDSRKFADPAPRRAHCIFEHVYFASPASHVFGQTCQTVRERLGERLAREAPVQADLVMPMPDSGRSAATGYARAMGLPYREGIIPNRYVGRTFIKPSAGERVQAVRLKLNVVADVVRNRRVIVVDDSIVRGTTTRAKMDQIRAAGAREIHLRISCPPIRHPCFFGVDFPDRQQLVAHGRDVEAIRRLLGVDTLAYLSLDGMLEVAETAETNREHYCTACYSGDYRITVPESQRKDILAKNC